MARILRWDRSGTIVTEPISYNTSSHLIDFFCRYLQASPDMRGLDQSVSTPTSAEAYLARTALGLEGSVPLFKLSVPDAGGGARYFITSPPQTTLYTPPGHATRGFRTYD